MALVPVSRLEPPNLAHSRSRVGLEPVAQVYCLTSKEKHSVLSCSSIIPEEASRSRGTETLCLLNNVQKANASCSERLIDELVVEGALAVLVLANQ
jgi:hypothetical protein